MNILPEPLVNYIILFSFLFFFSSESWENRDLQFKKKIDSQFIQNRATRLHVVYYCI